MRSSGASNKKPISVVPVILCGGSGKRLWPLSRRDYPKQFINIFSEHSLLQMTISRLNDMDKLSSDINLLDPILVSSEKHKHIIQLQLNSINHKGYDLILEPYSRNTAPAITVATLHANKTYGDVVVACFPSDHFFKDISELQEVLSQASILSSVQETINLVGVSPTSDNNNYGYIKTRKSSMFGNKDYSYFEVDSFFEKPDIETINKELSSKNDYWNAGIFIFKSSKMMTAISKINNSIMEVAKSSYEDATVNKREILLGDAYKDSENISFDQSIIQNLDTSSDIMNMFPVSGYWTDLGSWSAIRDYFENDKDSNSNIEIGNIITQDSYGNFFHSPEKLVAVIGVENLTVINTQDATLIMKNDKKSDIRNITNLLERKDCKELLNSSKSIRPWGWYTNIDEGPGFKVKRIHINPKSAISLQKHEHRSEHWVVTKGEAEVVKGDLTLYLKENDSVTIELQEVHRLANLNEEPLEIIEVQLGPYLEEDDIIRFEDMYGRIKPQ